MTPRRPLRGGSRPVHDSLPILLRIGGFRRLRRQTGHGVDEGIRLFRRQAGRYHNSVLDSAKVTETKTQRERRESVSERDGLHGSPYNAALIGYCGSSSSGCRHGPRGRGLTG